MNNNSTYRCLGDYIEQRREKNKGFDVPIRGVSKEGFIPPKQQDADVNMYNVFYKNDFVFNPARMELNSIALNEDLEQGICSSLYEIFYIKDTNVLNPLYLNLLIKTDHFTRFCEFVGWGSVREYCRFADISEYYIEVPPIEVQNKIVSHFNAIRAKIANNKQTIAKLEEAAQALYRKMFVDGIDVNNLPEGWRMGCLVEVAEINPTLKVKNELCSFIDMDAVSIDKMTTTAKGIREKTGGSKFQNEDVLLARITPCFENGKVGIVVGLKDEEIAIESTEFIVLRGKELNMPMFLYLICKSNEFRAYGSKHLKGTQRLDWQSVADYPIIIPSFEFMNRINSHYDIFFNFVKKLELENEKLTEMLSVVMV